MTLKAYGVVLAAVAVLGWASVATILFGTSAVAAGHTGTLLFFVSVGLAFASSSAFVGLVLRRHTIGHEAAVAASLRQGVLLALCAISLLWLQAERQLTVLTGGSTVALAIAFEAIFLWRPWKSR
ncbi:hypothetical protein HY442_01430 [Candidatus Parcubacteria bacterium]|nr:hypothetical protein [Candidatus Parcubacteria bacterium]